MNYYELCGMLLHDNIVLLYDYRYTYEFQKIIRCDVACIKMIKYKGAIIENKKIYSFIETMGKNPSDEVTKILNNTKVLTVIEKAGVK